MDFSPWNLSIGLSKNVHNWDSVTQYLTTDLKVKWCIYKAPLSQMSQRRFTMINLPPSYWKHIQAQIAAASKKPMHAGTHFTDLGRMERCEILGRISR